MCLAVVGCHYSISYLRFIGIIVLSVKPQFRHEVFNELKRTNFMGVPMVISLMAGIKTPVLQKEVMFCSSEI